MKKEKSDKEAREIARQLRSPAGDAGVEMGKRMDTINTKMTRASIDLIPDTSTNNLLEIGHGNCGHLEYLLKKFVNLSYYGLEISETMHSQAKKLNAHLEANNDGSFQLYDGAHVPFADHFFNTIFTVNTIYFWKSPEIFLSEFFRVLKSGGSLITTFATKKFMKALPFAKHDFNLYDIQDVRKLVATTGFDISESKQLEEVVRSKDRTLENRVFLVIKMKKMPYK